MAQREPHLDRLQPMTLLFRGSPRLWGRPWSRLCSIAFIATIVGVVLSRAEEPPCRTQEPCAAAIAQLAACEPGAARPDTPGTSACDRAAPDTVTMASGEPLAIPDECTGHAPGLAPAHGQDASPTRAPSDECPGLTRPVTHAHRWNADPPPRPR